MASTSPTPTPTPLTPTNQPQLSAYHSGISALSNASTIVGSSNAKSADETGVLAQLDSPRSAGVTSTRKSNIPSLPPGAALPSVLPGVYPAPDSPPADPSQRLLDSSYNSNNSSRRQSIRSQYDDGGERGVQFAAYPPIERTVAWDGPPRVTVTDSEKLSSSQQALNDDGDDAKRGDTWVPLPLRTWFWVSLVIFLAGGAIALEVALHFSNKNRGWYTKGDITDSQDVMHYVYTLPPVAVAAFLVAMWTWTDIEIKKMQPYVDLVQGDSPPQRSLLLDYTRYNNFIVWARAVGNRHYLVMITSFMVLLSLTFQPLAAALLVVKDVWWTSAPTPVNNLALLGLNQNEQFGNLTSFVTAAGYAAASVLYNLGNPPFLFKDYTVGEFEIPRDQVVNGTVVANTTAVKSDSGCRPISIQMTQNADGSGWSNSVNSNGCTFNWSVDRNATVLFGSDIPDCGQPPDQAMFAPVIFWFFTYQPVAAASGTICSPSFSLFDVAVTVDVASGNLTDVNELRPFSTSSNFSEFAGNLTGPPLNGRAYNGIGFQLISPDRFILERASSVRLQMPAAVLQAAAQSPAGLVGSFAADRFVTLSTQVYLMYLKLIAKEVYFLRYPNDRRPIDIQIKQWVKRLFLSDAAVHILATFLFILAFLSTVIQIWHRYARRNLRLLHEPGTIASAVSIGAQTGAGVLLAGQQREEDINKVLRGKKFRIDPRTMKIVMEGETGYEYASSPIERRRSVFYALQQGFRLKDNGEEMGKEDGIGGLGRRISRRVSAMVVPTSPKSPKSPTSPKSPMPA